MKVNKITNYVIVALVIAAVYQTGELWLSGTMRHNFFYAITDLFSKDHTDQLSSNALLMTRYAIGDGASNFYVSYPDSAGNSDTLEIADAVLQEIWSENIGKNIEMLDADWKSMLQNRCIVLDYGFLISMDEYLANIRSLKNGQDLEQFDYIILAPARRTGEESRAYFVNSYTNEAICYTAYKSKSAPILYPLLQPEQSDMVYISTGQKTGSAVLRHNQFLPQWASLPYSYATVDAQVAFEENNALSRTLLENTAEHFFGNFSLDWSTRDENGNFIFSDSSVVLKYYPRSRILEYYNYDNYGSDEAKTSLLDGYQICKNFLKNDASLQTSVYLSEISTNGNEQIYYFDYAVNDIPIQLSESIQEQIGATHAIEITIQNESVKKYRRYAYNFSASNTHATLNVPFIDALDTANRLYQETIGMRDITEVQNIFLAYDIQENTGNTLCWFVTLYDETFSIPADNTTQNITETEDTATS